MGGMGRGFDGGYAQFIVIPPAQVIAIETDLPWEIVGALPEMLQTAYGSLTTGLNLRPARRHSSAVARRPSAWPPPRWPAASAQRSWPRRDDRTVCRS
jgi:hypothetical protein